MWSHSCTPVGCSSAQVGRPPESHSLTIYLNRLREHGWDTQPMVRKLLMAGVHLAEDIKGEVMPGQGRARQATHVREQKLVSNLGRSGNMQASSVGASCLLFTLPCAEFCLASNP
jgi:hypothetical protein